jgi:hypothetical protein
MNPSDYQSYGRLPPLAGIGSFADAMHIGLPIDECVSRLKRHHWIFRRLHEIFLKRLTAEPIYELKMAFSLHAHYCAEHAAAWRKRVGEMREPPLGLDQVPDAALDALCSEVLAAPATGEVLHGIYAVILPALKSSLEGHLRTTNRLVDHPTVRICRFALIEIEEMIAFGAEALRSPVITLPDPTWPSVLSDLLRAAGGLDGSHPKTASVTCTVHYALNPPAYDPRPQRDGRFPDPYNLGVNAEAFLSDPQFPPEPKPLLLYFKRLREIDVPEMMASIIVETPGRPWDYAVDMTRQLWDEARHALMGEVGFIRSGLDWRKFVRVNFTWSLALNTQLQPLERHAVLYFIEHGLMPKTGKRFEWETGIASGDPYAAMIQDYDWADEVLHTRIGRDWYAHTLADPRRAATFGEECWARVRIDAQDYVNAGLTTHENWWPAAYREWCRVNQRPIDDDVLAYATSYSEPASEPAKLGASS